MCWCVSVFSWETPLLAGGRELGAWQLLRASDAIVAYVVCWTLKRFEGHCRKAQHLFSRPNTRDAPKCRWLMTAG